MRPDCQVGLSFEWSYTIPERVTVPNLYHDTVFCRDMPDVLATGYLVGLMELACLHGLMPYMDWPYEQSVGVMVQFSHIAPTPPGVLLTICGQLTAVEDRLLTFSLAARDGCDKVAEGTHQRMLILRERFEAKALEKKIKLSIL